MAGMVSIRRAWSANFARLSGNRKGATTDCQPPTPLPRSACGASEPLRRPRGARTPGGRPGPHGRAGTPAHPAPPGAVSCRRDAPAKALHARGEYVGGAVRRRVRAVGRTDPAPPGREWLVIPREPVHVIADAQ